MATYDIENRPSLLAFGDTVIFKVEKKVLTYDVRHNHLNCLGNMNETVFVGLGIDKKEFCKEVYGSRLTGDGDWPVPANTNGAEDHMVQLTDCVNAIFDFQEGDATPVKERSHDYAARVIYRNTVPAGINFILGTLKTSDTSLPSPAAMLKKLEKAKLALGFTVESVEEIMSALIGADPDLKNLALYVEAMRSKQKVAIFCPCPDDMFLQLLDFLQEKRLGKEVREHFADYEPNALQAIADKLYEAGFLKSVGGLSVAPAKLAEVQTMLATHDMSRKNQFSCEGYTPAEAEAYAKLK